MTKNRVSLDMATFQNTKTEETSSNINSNEHLIQLPPKSSELRNLSFNDGSSLESGYFSAYSLDSNPVVTKLASPTSFTLTSSNRLSSTKQCPLQHRGSVSTPEFTGQKSENASKKTYPMIISQSTRDASSSSNTSSDYTKSSMSNDLSYSISSKSSITSFGTGLEPSSIKLQNNASSKTLHADNQESSPSVGSASLLGAQNHGNEKYCTLPNMRLRKPSQQSLLKQRSRIVGCKKSSHSLRSKPSMLDLIDSNKLTTFPQVYSSFASLANNSEHSSSHSPSIISASQDKYFDGETLSASLINTSKPGSQIVFVEDYFDDAHLKNKSARNFSNAKFSSANFDSDSLKNYKCSMEQPKSESKSILNSGFEDERDTAGLNQTHLKDKLIGNLENGKKPDSNTRIEKTNADSLTSLEQKDFDDALGFFNLVPSTPSESTIDLNSSSIMGEASNTNTITSALTPKQSSRRTVSSSSQSQLSPFSTMRRGSVIKACIHCQKPLHELSNTQYSEFVCNDCAGFHQLLADPGNSKHRSYTHKKLKKVYGFHQGSGNWCDMNQRSYNTGPSLHVKKLRNSSTLELPRGDILNSPCTDEDLRHSLKLPRNNVHYTLKTGRKFESDFDLPSSAYDDNDEGSSNSLNFSNRKGPQAIGPNTSTPNLLYSSSSSSLPMPLFARECQQRGINTLANGNFKMEWYATMRKKLRWRWRISGLLPSGMVPAAKL